MVHTLFEITIIMLHRSELGEAFVPTISFLIFQLLKKKGVWLPCFAKFSGKCISTTSSKQHNENVCVQKHQSTFKSFHFKQRSQITTLPLTSSVRTQANFINNSKPKFHHLRKDNKIIWRINWDGVSISMPLTSSMHRTHSKRHCYHSHLWCRQNQHCPTVCSTLGAMTLSVQGCQCSL